ncbi:MAG: YccF domain-containing protein [Rhodobacteraceae bacterium]|uniref:YccF domain-containing protein n=1 Tax=Accumulibacter sp. TaxID=2053492 RepID=UPI0019F6B3EC|nr:YccF domain-containing protein [Accumulibacter sp.]MBE2259149.1 YccF domain-containing protein [Paracoccaceae bacterium]MCB1940988.1 YccF domain-containing protein [Accumulibacter sp.]
MRAVGNFLWFVFGGLLMGLAWWLAGLIMLLTIVGIPWAKASFVIGQFSFFPFGKEAISRKELRRHDDIGTGTLGVAGNVIWFVLAGLWLAIGHLASALACALTIIGIPFAIQHLKLAGIALAPIGKTIVSKEVAEAARAARATAEVTDLRLKA